jgi:hypothetical protein
VRPNRGAVLAIVAAAILQAATPTSVSYSKFPLAFERRGNGTQQRYVTHANGYLITLHNGSAIIEASEPISMDFIGVRNVAGKPGRELPGTVNYLSGSNPR